MNAHDWLFLWIVLVIGMILMVVYAVDLIFARDDLKKVKAELERERLMNALRGGEELTRIKETVGFIAEELAQLARTDAETEVGA